MSDEHEGMNGHGNGHANGTSIEAHVVDPEEMIARGQQDDARTEIEVFIAKEMSRGPVARFELRMLTPQGDQRVGDWTDQDFEGKGPEELASEIFERAREDARSQIGEQRYAIAVYRAEGRPYAGRRFFNMPGGQSEFSDSLDVVRHPSTAQGVLGQTLEHNQANHVLNHKLVQYIVGILQQRIRDLERSNEKLLSMHTRTVEAHERLVSEEHRRQLELRKMRFDEMKSEKLFEQIMLILPIIFRFAVGDKSASLQLAGLETQLHSLVGSLSEQQMGAVMRAMDPAQQASFLQLAQSLAQKKTESVDAQLRQRAIQEEKDKAKLAADAKAAEDAAAKAAAEAFIKDAKPAQSAPASP